MKFRRKPPPKSTANPALPVLRIGRSGADHADFQEISVNAGETLLEALERNDVSMFSSCGGYGTCGTCRVKVLDGFHFLSARNEIELEMTKDRSFSDRERLTCQTTLIPSIPQTEQEIRITLELPNQEPK